MQQVYSHCIEDDPDCGDHDDQQCIDFFRLNEFKISFPEKEKGHDDQ
ncbi:hypothetical protein SDC9_147809 [bioreactor metagenome]|uniref:Uncharacterized protein n=1 Tax=bioreactor metagenome TaxID=1076179 RepID=A0A645EJ60_9ZZZZ